jgi:anti-sigma factor RsiW
MPDAREERLGALRAAAGEELDSLLSAWVDGSLAADEAEVLSARALAEPEIAARYAALAAVDSALRAISLPEVPERLRAGLRARIESLDSEQQSSLSSLPPGAVETAQSVESAQSVEFAQTIQSVQSRRPRHSSRARARWLLPAAAALAAGLALLLLSQPAAPPGELAGEPMTLAARPESMATPAAEEVAALAVADDGLQEGIEIGDAELSIALDFGLLREFELLEQLELLELLAELDQLDGAEAG